MDKKNKIHRSYSKCKFAELKVSPIKIQSRSLKINSKNIFNSSLFYKKNKTSCNQNNKILVNVKEQNPKRKLIENMFKELKNINNVYDHLKIEYQPEKVSKFSENKNIINSPSLIKISSQFDQNISSRICLKKVKTPDSVKQVKNMKKLTSPLKMKFDKGIIDFKLSTFNLKKDNYKEENLDISNFKSEPKFQDRPHFLNDFKNSKYEDSKNSTKTIKIKEEPMRRNALKKKFIKRTKSKLKNIQNKRPKEFMQLKIDFTNKKFLNINNNQDDNLFERKKSILINQNLKKIKSKTNNRYLSLRKKVYDSLSEGDHLEENIKVTYLYGIDSESKFKFYADFLFGLNLLLSLILILLFISYVFVKHIEKYLLLIYIYFAFLTDFCNFMHFILSLFFSFSTDEEKKVFNISKTSVYYLKHFGKFDVINLVPINFIFSASFYLNYEMKSELFGNLQNKINKVYLVIIMIFSFLKLFKFLDKNMIFSKTVDYINDNIGISKVNRKVIYYWIVIFYLSNIFSFLWILIGSLNYENWMTNLDIQDESYFYIYICSLYFSMSTLFTVGYGDIIPRNNSEKLFLLLTMIVSFIVYTITVSNISNIIKIYEDENVKLSWMQNYIANAKNVYSIDETFYLKLKNFIRFKFISEQHNKYLLLNELPSSLKNELSCKVFNRLIILFKFFKPVKIYDEANNLILLEPEFVVSILKVITPYKALKNDYLIYQNQIVEEMFLLKSGILSIEVIENNQIFKLINLHQGEHIGDIAMILNQKIKYSVKVKSCVAELFIISKFDLLKISYCYSNIFKEILKTSIYNNLVLEVMVNDIENPQLKTNIQTNEIPLENFDENSINKENKFFDSSKTMIDAGNLNLEMKKISTASYVVNSKPISTRIVEKPELIIIESNIEENQLDSIKKSKIDKNDVIASKLSSVSMLNNSANLVNPSNSSFSFIKNEKNDFNKLQENFMSEKNIVKSRFQNRVSNNIINLNFNITNFINSESKIASKPV